MHEDAFDDAFRTFAPRVYAYARRHIDLAECDDVVAETFLIAWRRLSEVPSAPLPWLIVTARHVIANRVRGRRRAESLWQQAVSAYWHQPASLAPAEIVAERDALIGALCACSPAEREALLLTAWDGLTYAEAAAVLRCSERALTVRISRGRARLTQTLRSADHPDATAPSLRLVEDMP